MPPPSLRDRALQRLRCCWSALDPASAFALRATAGQTSHVLELACLDEARVKRERSLARPALLRAFGATAGHKHFRAIPP